MHLSHLEILQSLSKCLQSNSAILKHSEAQLTQLIEANSSLHLSLFAFPARWDPTEIKNSSTKLFSAVVWQCEALLSWIPKEWKVCLDNSSDSLFSPTYTSKMCWEKSEKMCDFNMYKKKVLKTHPLVNKDAKKTMGPILVSSAPILDWGPLLIPLGLCQGGICARERKAQPEVMQGNWSIP